MKRTLRRSLGLAAATLAALGSTLPTGGAQAAAFYVRTDQDAGKDSLRQAILDANTTAGADTIFFAIPGIGAQTIELLSPLPPIVDPVTIDGATQGPPSEHLIVLDGAQLPPHAIGLELRGDGSWVHHLVLHRFGTVYPDVKTAIWLSGTGKHVVSDCRLGTDAEGLVEIGNNVGIVVDSDANWIVGNLVSASREVGIHIGNLGDENLIEGNLLGSDRDGLPFAATRTASQLWGVAIGGARNEVRGNLIGGLTGGIWIASWPPFAAAENRIVANTIGLDAQGGRLGELYWAIRVRETSDGTVIGGTGANANHIAHVGRASWGYPQSSAVWVEDGTGHSVRGNLFHDLDGAMPIDLGAQGLDRNDRGDLDKGPNNLQNHPVITGAWELTWLPEVVVEGGLLGAHAPTDYILDVYATSSASAPGACEARRHLGSAIVHSTGPSVARFTIRLPVTVDPGAMVSATATVSGGAAPPDTSELSPCVLVQ